jgi:serine/threonine protein kinase
MIKGLVYLHSNEIIHRNIKPSNVFMKNDLIKLGDFGSIYESGKVDFTIINYKAPEILDNKINEYYFNSDVW